MATLFEPPCSCRCFPKQTPIRSVLGVHAQYFLVISGHSEHGRGIFADLQTRNHFLVASLSSFISFTLSANDWSINGPSSTQEMLQPVHFPLFCLLAFPLQTYSEIPKLCPTFCQLQLLEPGWNSPRRLTTRK